jgi:hypothetical protein
MKRKTGIIINERGNVISNDDETEDSYDINAGLYKTQQSNQQLEKHEKKEKEEKEKEKEKSYNSIKTYKPTGNLVYDTQLFEKIEKKVSFSS